MGQSSSHHKATPALAQICRKDAAFTKLYGFTKKPDGQGLTKPSPFDLIRIKISADQCFPSPTPPIYAGWANRCLLSSPTLKIIWISSSRFVPSPLAQVKPRLQKVESDSWQKWGGNLSESIFTEESRQSFQSRWPDNSTSNPPTAKPLRWQKMINAYRRN